MTPSARTRRWVVGGLALYAVAVAFVVFTPVSYSGVVHRLASLVELLPGMTFFGSGWIEFVANIVLFIPLGFFLTLLLRRPAIGAAIGIGISVCVELIQIVIPHRQATVRDVISNGIGAATGALIAWLVVRRRQRRDGSATRQSP
jgi:glycopeptide antibiotics resistance protein